MIAKIDLPLLYPIPAHLNSRGATQTPCVSRRKKRERSFPRVVLDEEEEGINLFQKALEGVFVEQRATRASHRTVPVPYFHLYFSCAVGCGVSDEIDECSTIPVPADGQEDCLSNGGKRAVLLTAI